jgi:acyl-coenzyme A thioesterase PaaI-like protein
MPLPRLVRRLRQQLRGPWLAPLLRFYGPYFGAGVRVRAEGPFVFVATMPLTRWNRNYFGTHFGGSLYAMCDPFFALILTQQLGRGYVVWDKSASIRFRRPGRGTVTARFAIDPDQVDAIRREVDARGRVDVPFRVAVCDAAGEVIAEVDKVVHIRRGDPVPAPPAAGVEG